MIKFSILHILYVLIIVSLSSCSKVETDNVNHLNLDHTKLERSNLANRDIVNINNTITKEDILYELKKTLDIIANKMLSLQTKIILHSNRKELNSALKKIGKEYVKVRNLYYNHKLYLDKRYIVNIDNDINHISEYSARKIKELEEKAHKDKAVSLRDSGDVIVRMILLPSKLRDVVDIHIIHEF